MDRPMAGERPPAVSTLIPPPWMNCICVAPAFFPGTRGMRTSEGSR